ncbi:hypothetical protein OHI49_002316 [Salmonella enterica]|nr:hypothetical protein [Salmonella enterica]
MGLYSAPELELLCQQVVRDNPELAGRISADSIGVRGIPAETTKNGRNTVITLVGKPGKGFSGECTVYYDRLTLSDLFKIAPRVYVPQTAKTVRDLLPALRDLYGVWLSDSSVQSVDAPIKSLATPTRINLTAYNSVCYRGYIPVDYLNEAVGYYPDSGPGNKYLLAGDSTNGYFGHVSQQELFTFAELNNLIRPDVAPTKMTFEWLKFFKDGKIVYLPTTGTLTATWTALYQAGAIFGTGDTGPYPDGIEPVDQALIVTKTENNKTHYYRVSVPVSPDLSKATPLWLISQLGDGSTGGDWANDTTLTRTTVFFTQQLLTGGNPVKVQRCNMRGGSVEWVTLTDTTYWWPVLEEINKDDIVLPLADVEGDVVWRVRVIPNVPSPQPDSIRPLAVEVATTDAPRPLATTAEQVEEPISPIVVGEPNVDTALPLSTVSKSVGTVRPMVVLEPRVDAPRPLPPTQAEPPLKTDLATANGELNGF